MALGAPPPGEDDELAPMAEINVTPFIDVMLVLLIIFMVTAPMLATGMKVDLPKAATARPLEQGKPVLVTLNAEGVIEVAERIVTLEQTAEAVRHALAGEERPIHVRADAAVSYGAVVAVLDALTGKGLPKFALAFDREKLPAARTPSAVLAAPP